MKTVLALARGGGCASLSYGGLRSDQMQQCVATMPVFAIMIRVNLPVPVGGTGYRGELKQCNWDDGPWTLAGARREDVEDHDHRRPIAELAVVLQLQCRFVEVREDGQVA